MAEYNIKDILTIPNGGGIVDINGRKHSNACMWISIKNYLQVFRDISIDVGELKDYAGISELDDLKEFNMETNSEQLRKIAIKYGLCIKIYAYSNHKNVGKLSGAFFPELGTCPSVPTVKIISYGRHFELFILKTEINTIRQEYRLLFKSYGPKVVNPDGDHTPEQIGKMSYEEQLKLAFKLSNKNPEPDPEPDPEPGGGAGKSSEDMDLEKAIKESKEIEIARFMKLNELVSSYQEIINKYLDKIKQNTNIKEITELKERMKFFINNHKEALEEMQKMSTSVYELLGGYNKHTDDNNRRKYLKYKFKYLQLKQK